MELVARHDHGLAAASQELQQELHDLPPHVRVHLQIDGHTPPVYARTKSVPVLVRKSTFDSCRRIQ